MCRYILYDFMLIYKICTLKIEERRKWMTSTLVRDVSTAMNDFMPKSASSPASGKADFKAIWNQQTGEHKSNGLEQKVEPEAANIPKTKNSLENKQDIGQVTGHSPNIDAEEEPLSQEDLERIMEVLNGSVVNFLPQVAEELQISEEELSYVLEELGMEPMDLLKPENLTNLLIAVEGDGDAMSLLTNEDLYQTLQNLTNQLEQLMNENSEELGIPKEQLPIVFEEVLQQISRESVVMPEKLQENNVVTNEVPVEEVKEVEEYNISDEIEPQVNLDKGKVITVTKTDTQQAEVHVSTTPSESSVGSNINKQDQKDSATSSHSEQQQGSLFTQNAIDNLVKPNVAQVNEAIFSEVDTEVIMKQIMDYMKIQVKPEFSTLEMQLHPESLGTLQVQLSSKQGAVTAQFVTQNEAVKVALEGQIVQLRENFEQQGVKVDAIEVTVQSHEFERNLEHGRQQQQDTPDQKVRRRKLDLSALNDVEELTQEDQLATEIMAANGSTVDYTV